MLADVFGLKCATGEMTNCKGACEHKAGFYFGRHWDACPVRSVYKDKRLMYVLTLESQAALAPIADWPDAFASWVPRLWRLVADAKASRRVTGG